MMPPPKTKWNSLICSTTIFWEAFKIFYLLNNCIIFFCNLFRRLYNLLSLYFLLLLPKQFRIPKYNLDQHPESSLVHYLQSFGRWKLLFWTPSHFVSIQFKANFSHCNIIRLSLRYVFITIMALRYLANTFCWSNYSKNVPIYSDVKLALYDYYINIVQ